MLAQVNLFSMATYFRRGACQGPHVGIIFGRCCPPHVFKQDIADGHVGRILVADGLVALPVALIDLDSPIVVVVVKCVIRDVLHVSRSSSSG